MSFAGTGRRRDDPLPSAAPSAAIADPAPLGLAAFALTTFVLSCFNAKLIGNVKLEAVVLPLALFYGGLTQLLAGMWEFRTGNTFGAVAFSSYGAFWLSFAGYARFVAPGLPPAETHTATGLFLLGWAIFTIYMTVAAIRVSGAVLAVFVLLSLTFVFLTWGALQQAPGVSQVGGWLGLLTAAAAWYASFAAVVNSRWPRPLVPTWPAR